ncbi:expressed unknown protein [Seminavis robusta]|uniref:Uncharacterized protein n=1 Tax=Seminavis robusta TaxID=568900 RepID=A0A9N8DPH2_9STRA|nr:expressed unknown protein [Seminavis robusta]|eukprot:Sro277_g106340.1 n/a (1586) ;mRNA; f:47651-52408
MAATDSRSSAATRKSRSGDGEDRFRQWRRSRERKRARAAGTTAGGSRGTSEEKTKSNHDDEKPSNQGSTSKEESTERPFKNEEPKETASKDQDEINAKKPAASTTSTSSFSIKKRKQKNRSPNESSKGPEVTKDTSDVVDDASVPRQEDPEPEENNHHTATCINPLVEEMEKQLEGKSNEISSLKQQLEVERQYKAKWERAEQELSSQNKQITILEQALQKQKEKQTKRSHQQIADNKTIHSLNCQVYFWKQKLQAYHQTIQTASIPVMLQRQAQIMQLSFDSLITSETEIDEALLRVIQEPFPALTYLPPSGLLPVENGPSTNNHDNNNMDGECSQNGIANRQTSADHASNSNASIEGMTAEANAATTDINKLVADAPDMPGEGRSTAAEKCDDKDKTSVALGLELSASNENDNDDRDSPAQRESTKEKSDHGDEEEDHGSQPKRLSVDDVDGDVSAHSTGPEGTKHSCGSDELVGDKAEEESTTLEMTEEATASATQKEEETAIHNDQPERDEAEETILSSQETTLSLTVAVPLHNKLPSEAELGTSTEHLDRSSNEKEEAKASHEQSEAPQEPVEGNNSKGRESSPVVDAEVALATNEPGGRPISEDNDNDLAVLEMAICDGDGTNEATSLGETDKLENESTSAEQRDESKTETPINVEKLGEAGLPGAESGKNDNSGEDSGDTSKDCQGDLLWSDDDDDNASKASRRSSQSTLDSWRQTRQKKSKENQWMSTRKQTIQLERKQKQIEDFYPQVPERAKNKTYSGAGRKSTIGSKKKGSAAKNAEHTPGAKKRKTIVESEEQVEKRSRRRREPNTDLSGGIEIDDENAGSYETPMVVKYKSKPQQISEDPTSGTASKPRQKHVNRVSLSATKSVCATPDSFRTPQSTQVPLGGANPDAPNGKESNYRYNKAVETPSPISSFSSQDAALGGSPADELDDAALLVKSKDRPTEKAKTNKTRRNGRADTGRQAKAVQFVDEEDSLLKYSQPTVHNNSLPTVVNVVDVEMEESQAHQNDDTSQHHSGTTKHSSEVSDSPRKAAFDGDTQGTETQVDPKLLGTPPMFTKKPSNPGKTRDTKDPCINETPGSETQVDTKLLHTAESSSVKLDAGDTQGSETQVDPMYFGTSGRMVGSQAIKATSGGASTLAFADTQASETQLDLRYVGIGIKAGSQPKKSSSGKANAAVADTQGSETQFDPKWVDGSIANMAAPKEVPTKRARTNVHRETVPQKRHNDTQGSETQCDPGLLLDSTPQKARYGSHENSTEGGKPKKKNSTSQATEKALHAAAVPSKGETTSKFTLTRRVPSFSSRKTSASAPKKKKAPTRSNQKGWISTRKEKKSEDSFETMTTNLRAPVQYHGRANRRIIDAKLPVRSNTRAPGKENDNEWMEDSGPQSPQSPNYAYIDPRRSRKHVQACDRRDCPECKAFYDVVTRQFARQGMVHDDFQMARQDRVQHSRHTKWTKGITEQNTPDGFWEMSFKDSLDRKAEEAAAVGAAALQDRQNQQDIMHWFLEQEEDENEEMERMALAEAAATELTPGAYLVEEEKQATSTSSNQEENTAAPQIPEGQQVDEEAEENPYSQTQI